MKVSLPGPFLRSEPPEVPSGLLTACPPRPCHLLPVHGYPTQPSPISLAVDQLPSSEDRAVFRPLFFPVLCPKRLGSSQGLLCARTCTVGMVRTPGMIQGLCAYAINKFKISPYIVGEPPSLGNHTGPCAGSTPGHTMSKYTSDTIEGLCKWWF